MPLDLVGALLGWVAADVGDNALRGVGRVLLGPPQRRALQAVVAGAVDRAVDAAGLSPRRQAHLRAVLLERSVAEEALLLAGSGDVDGVIRAWLAELDQPGTGEAIGYLSGIGVSPAKLADALVGQVSAGLAADARRGGPLGPLVEALWRDQVAAQLDRLVAERPDARAQTLAGLPATPQLIGRGEAMDRLLAAQRQIVAIDGMAGVGKTAFAVRAAEELSGSYPDGVFYLDLHGYTDGVAPLEPVTALGQLLHDAGVPLGETPAGLAARVARWRSVMAGRRCIIVLDNAYASAQVRPLLPAARSALVLITSRRRLIGLPEAWPISLDVLSPADAAVLFAELCGHDDPAAAALASLCGRLPLALAVAAARLRHDPSLTAAALAEMLAGERARLAELSPEQAGVHAAFAASLRHADEPAAGLFALLGLHPGPDLAAGPVAALAAIPAEDAARLLRDLADQHLVQCDGPDRYSLHDLIRTYARSLTTGLDRIAALDRLVEHYRTVVQGPGGDDVLAAERDNLHELVRAHRTAAAATVGCAAADRLRRLGFPDHAGDLFRLGWTTASATADAELAAQSALGLATVARFADDYATARSWLERAHARHQATGDRRGQAQAIRGIAGIAANVGDFAAADEHNRQALAVFTELGDRQGIADATVGLAFTSRRTDDATTARRLYRAAYRTYRHIHDPFGAANALAGLAALAPPAQARRLYQRALELADGSGNQLGRAQALRGVARLDTAAGDYPAAITGHEQAMDIYTALGDRLGRIKTLNDLADTEHTRGRPDAAAALHAQALALAEEIHNPYATTQTLRRAATQDPTNRP